MPESILSVLKEARRAVKKKRPAVGKKTALTADKEKAALFAARAEATRIPEAAYLAVDLPVGINEAPVSLRDIFVTKHLSASTQLVEMPAGLMRPAMLPSQWECVEASPMMLMGQTPPPEAGTWRSRLMASPLSAFLKKRGKHFKTHVVKDFVVDPVIRYAVAYKLGTREVASPRVTDAIVRLFWRSRSEAYELKVLAAQGYTGRHNARRRARGDFPVVRRDGTLGKPYRRPDASSPTSTGVGLYQPVNVTIRGDRIFGKPRIDLNYSRTVAVRHREIGGLLTSLAMHPLWHHDKTPPATVEWMLRRLPWEDYLHGFLRTVFPEFREPPAPGDKPSSGATMAAPVPGTDTGPSSPPVPFRAGLPLTFTVPRHAEEASILMPMLATFLLAMGGNGVLPEAEGRNNLPVLEMLDCIMPKGGVRNAIADIWHRATRYKAQPAWPSGVVPMISPAAMINEVEAGAVDEAMQNGQVTVFDISKTVMRTEADNRPDNPPPDWLDEPITPTLKRIPLFKFITTFMLQEKDPKALSDRITYAARNVGKIRVFEYNPAENPVATAHLFAYAKAVEPANGLWAVQSGTSSHDEEVGKKFNQQWAAQSCMAKEEKAIRAAAFYMQQTDTRMAVALDGLGRVVGRALVWPTSKRLEGKRWITQPPIMERLYVTTPRAAKAFAEYAVKRGYMHRTHMKPSNHVPATFTWFEGGVKLGDNHLSVMVPTFGWHAPRMVGRMLGVPYLDTFMYLAGRRMGDKAKFQAFGRVFNRGSGGTTREENMPQIEYDSMGNQQIEERDAANVGMMAPPSLIDLLNATSSVWQDRFERLMDENVPYVSYGTLGSQANPWTPGRVNPDTLLGESTPDRAAYFSDSYAHVLLWNGTAFEARQFVNSFELHAGVMEAAQNWNGATEYLRINRWPYWPVGGIIGPREAFEEFRINTELTPYRADDPDYVSRHFPKGVFGRDEGDPWNPMSYRAPGSGRIAVGHAVRVTGANSTLTDADLAYGPEILSDPALYAATKNYFKRLCDEQNPA